MWEESFGDVLTEVLTNVRRPRTLRGQEEKPGGWNPWLLFSERRLRGPSSLGEWYRPFLKKWSFPNADSSQHA